MCTLTSRHKYVRSVQALVGHTVSQCLVFLIMVLSLERWPIDGVCFTLGLLLHYTILVSYFWLIIRSIVVVLRETRRQMYERNCFIMPFIILAWGECSVYMQSSSSSTFNFHFHSYSNHTCDDICYHISDQGIV